MRHKTWRILPHSNWRLHCMLSDTVSTRQPRSSVWQGKLSRFILSLVDKKHRWPNVSLNLLFANIQNNNVNFKTVLKNFFIPQTKKLKFFTIKVHTSNFLKFIRVQMRSLWVKPKLKTLTGYFSLIIFCKWSVMNMITLSAG